MVAPGAEHLLGDDGGTVVASLRTNLSNAPEIVAKAVAGEFDRFVFLSPHLLCDRFNLSVALLRVFNSRRDGKMTARTVGTELYCALAATKSIRSAIKEFQLRPSSSQVCVIGFNPSPCDLADVDTLLASSEAIALDRLPEFFDLPSAAKIFKLSKHELDQTKEDIFSSIGNRIAIGEALL